MVAGGAWVYAIESPLPRSLPVGAGTAMFVSGWVLHRQSPVREVGLRLGDAGHPVPNHSMPRIDVYGAEARPGDRPAATTYRSGFWGVFPVRGVTEPVEAPLVLEAVNEAGDRFEAALATLRLLPPAGPPAGQPEPGLVAICMATYNPDLDLFRRQITSIRNQTHENWRCIVNDDRSDGEAYAGIESTLAGDPRFELHRNAERLGVYFNFERALELAPPSAEAVALSDQDDEWRPAKIATLLAFLREGHTLVYSDQRIVSREGDVLAPTYWKRRENQWTDVRSLAVANTVTGAASLFRRDLLDVALPFPARLAGAYHDHWLALTALACGTIGYRHEPLYDYVQHDAQLLGHPAGRPEASEGPPPQLLDREERWQRTYFAHVVPPQLTATALLERAGSRLRADARAPLESVAAADSTVGGVLALARSTRALRAANDDEALGALAGVAWRHWSRWRARRAGVPPADALHSLDARVGYAEYRPENR